MTTYVYYYTDIALMIIFIINLFKGGKQWIAANIYRNIFS